MRKTLFTLNAGGTYAPDIVKLTYPYMERYARRIGADFHVITERKYPKYPVIYEKFQVYELGRGNDWNLFVDSDALISPDLFDITEHFSKDTVVQWGSDPSVRWDYDDYFRRDGRHLSACNWFTLTSNWTHDLWTPLTDMTPKEAISHIHPIISEVRRSMDPSHFLDDYVISRNLARYGLKYKVLKEMYDGFRIDGEPLLHHFYQFSEPEKFDILRNIVTEWQSKIR